MTLTYRKGSMFDSTAQAFAHGVNTQGVMGAGVARQIRERYPTVYSAYREHCEGGYLMPGYTLAVAVTFRNHMIYNLATQDLPGPHARLEWVESALTQMVDKALDYGDLLVAMPKIGCGIGGLNWSDVEPLVAKAATSLDIEVWEL